jgi:Protein of unknown function (DUF4242)
MCRRSADRSVESVREERRRMETYVIMRRNGWQAAESLHEALARAAAEDDGMSDDVAWIRSYVLEEHDGSVGMVCVYQAASPEAVRRHARAASLPVDEIRKVADSVIVRPDPAAVTALREGDR